MDDELVARDYRELTDAQVEAARHAARTGDLRLAYHHAYRALDLLLKNAMWNEIAIILDEICSDKYPVDFGIGILRFVSSASRHIPRWEHILQQAVRLAKAERRDAKRAMRGLVGINEASKGR